MACPLCQVLPPHLYLWVECETNIDTSKEPFNKSVYILYDLYSVRSRARVLPETTHNGRLTSTLITQGEKMTQSRSKSDASSETDLCPPGREASLDKA